jgi:hypothetical protein
MPPRVPSAPESIHPPKTFRESERSRPCEALDPPTAFRLPGTVQGTTANRFRRKVIRNARKTCRLGSLCAMSHQARHARHAHHAHCVKHRHARHSLGHARHSLVHALPCTREEGGMSESERAADIRLGKDIWVTPLRSERFHATQSLMWSELA